MRGETYGGDWASNAVPRYRNRAQRAKRDVAATQGDTEKGRVEPWPPRALRPTQEPDLPQGRITRGKPAAASRGKGKGL